MAMYTVGRLAKRFGLCRSTLLYYNAIGLLKPSARSSANYRLYSEADARQLERIKVYREAGLPLESIGALLQDEGGAGNDAIAALLERHLHTLSREIARLREQQRCLGALLQDEGGARTVRGSRALGKAQWVALLASSGMSDADMDVWHAAFEGRFPEAHQDFLESLGITPQEIAAIRKRSACGGKDD